MARDKGKRPAIDQRSKMVFKRSIKGGGSSRGRNTGIVIEEPQDAPNTPIPIAFNQRFISPEAKKAYTKRYISRKMLTEKPLVLGEVNPEFLNDLDKMGFGELKVVPDVPLNDTVVREFYANLDRACLSQGFVWVRKVKVEFNPKIINAKYKLPDFGENDKDYKYALKALTDSGKDPLEELRVLIHEPTPWTLKSDNERKEISTADWPEDWRVKCRFIQNRLLPKYNISHFGIDDLGMLYAVAHKLVINVGRVLYDEIVGHLTNKSRCIIVPYLIHSLCRDAKVPEYGSDHTTKKPKGIKREPKRVQLLAKKGIETGGPVGDETASEEEDPESAPTQNFTEFEKMQLKIAQSIAVWFEENREAQEVIVKNQERIAKKLGVKGVKSLEDEPSFLYHKQVQKAFRTNFLIDSDESEDEGDTGEKSAESSSSSSSEEGGAGEERDASGDETGDGDGALAS